MAWFVPMIPYVVAAVGAVYAGNQAKASANRGAAVDEQNATLARQQGAADEETQRRKNALIMGDVRASAAESGFAPGGGSLLALQTKTAGELELDALTTRYRGELQSLGLKDNAAVGRSNARAAETSGYLNAAGYLAGGAAKYSGGTKISAPAATPPRSISGGFQGGY